MIILQPTANLSHPLWANAEPTRATARVGHPQDKYVVCLATRGLQAILRVPDSPGADRLNADAMAGP
jgi:hypothetical protein